MGKIFTIKMLSAIIIMSLVTLSSYAQTTVSGTVTEASSGEPLVGVNIVVKGKVIGTITDFDGNFQLSTSEAPPLTLVFSIIGFAPQELEITQANVDGLAISLEEQAILGQEVVVSASRVQESILESPVTIEKLDILAIQNAASTDFYDAIKNLKGVDFSTQSLTFKSINARGFGANGNTRFVQLIDGIDNQAPGLNFPVGNVVGINELDLESAELIPGAASALYGPNAIQGILLLNSKSPFEYQGLSAFSKSGVNHVDEVEDDLSFYQDYGVRYAKAFNNKFAFKVTASYLRANDFVAADFRDESDLIERSPDVNANELFYRQQEGVSRVYDGLNVYGDPVIPVALGLSNPALAPVAALIPLDETGNFTPTGFTEGSFVDNTTESIKVGAALHYRLNDNIEAIGQFNWGSGSTVFTANDRFVLDNFRIFTAKLELKNPNWYLRAYTTQESSGDTFNANAVASIINANFYAQDYIGAFATARGGGASVDAAHAFARNQADLFQANGGGVAGEAYLPGTPLFQSEFDRIRNIPISEGGGLFLDETGLWHAEGSYNFQELVDVVDIVIGANYRRFNLVSDGTLFALEDNGEEVSINEGGAYVQVGKNFFSDNLKLQASLRYDKNEFFDAQFSPRFSAVQTIAQDHNIRASFQRGFRIPTTQDQFIDLDVVSRRLIGSNAFISERFNLQTNTVYNTEDVLFLNNQVNSGALTSAEASQQLAPEPRVFDEFDTEKINTFEIGYKGLLFDSKLLVDAYYYYSIYEDFIAEIDLTQVVDITDTDASDGFSPVEGFEDDSDVKRQAVIAGGGVPGGRIQRYGFDINASGNVESQGWALGLEYSLPRGFKASGNVSFNQLISQNDLQEQGFNAQFNTPEYRYNFGISNREVVKNVGFNVTWRWQQAYLWESAFGEGVVPEFGTLDAQISYKLEDLKTIVKFGASNLLNERYETSLGNPRLGGIYFVQLSFDQFLN